MNRGERGDEAKLKLTVGVLFAVPSANRRKRDMTEALGVASQELSRDDFFFIFFFMLVVSVADNG